MSTERQENNDGGNKEVILTRPTPQWMAGVWEIGGEMGFDYYTKKGHVYVYPRMSVTDNDVETSQYLDYHYPSQRDLLHRGNSWQWIREGGNVVDITKIMYPYVVRRKSIVEAFIAWGGTNSRDRRVAIADGFNTQ